MERERFDVLGDRPERRAALAPLLDDAEDPILDSITERTARTLNAPIALVSLVLDRTQFFKAHFGLPADLAAARSTDRDVSFCQLVVRDEMPVDVARAPRDARVPQYLVDRYGIRSYLGTPIHCGSTVVGALCVLDTTEREFSTQELATLQQLADQVDERLRALSEHQRQHRAVNEAARPAVAETRNLLTALELHLTSARLALGDLSPVVCWARSQVQQDSEGFSRGAQAYPELLSTLNDLDEIARRLKEQQAAVEGLLSNPERTTLGYVVEAAAALALHETRLIGGAESTIEQPQLWVAAPRPVAVSAVAGVLATVSSVLRTQGHTSGLRVTTDHSQLWSYVNVGPLPSPQGTLADRIDDTVPSDPSLEVRVLEDTVRIALKRDVN